MRDRHWIERAPTPAQSSVGPIRRDLLSRECAPAKLPVPMNALRNIVASALTLLAGGLLFAAEPIKRVIVVTDVETDDASGYASWIAKSNEAAKAKFGAETYLKVYQSVFDGMKTGSVRVVAIGESIAS